jgi:DNA-binding transcriptional LysR family regulator
VRANEVDVGLITSGEVAVRDPLLVPTLLADYETRVVMPPGHSLADESNRAAVPASALADHLLILMNTGTNLRAYADGLLSAAGVTNASVAMELDNVEAIKRMIEAGLGVSLLPEVSVRDEAASGRLIALRLGEVPHASRRIALVYRRDKYLPTALRAFVDLVRAAIGSNTHNAPAG